MSIAERKSFESLGSVCVPSSWGTLRPPVFLTYRRHLLDAYLSWASPLMHGNVLDLGGKRENKRGAFRPPTNANRWLYVNAERSTRPDVCADAAHVPLTDGCVDCIVCTEVFEHLAEPAACAAECYRLLKTGGVLIMSAPFLYPVHADPHDFQRFTVDGITHLLRSFRETDVRPMGGWYGAMSLLLETRTWTLNSSRVSVRLTRRTLSLAARGLAWLDLRAGAALGKPSLPAFTTGYFALARK